jgi:hypothetical protein
VSSVMYLSLLCLLYFVKVNDRPLVYRFCEALNLKGGNTFQKFKEFKRESRYDVIVLGSSHAYRGYDPRIFAEYGINMFNLGTSGQTMVNSYFVARNHISKSSCKLIVLDVFDGALMNDEMESSADLIQNIDDDETALQLSLHMKDPRAINMFFVRQLNKGKKPYYTDTMYTGNGFSQNDQIVTGKLNYSFYEKKEISAVQLHYLEKLLTCFEELNLPCVLVNGPFPDAWDLAGHNKFDVDIEKMAALHHVLYLDFGTMKLNRYKYFYDSHHLNQAGVNVFNHALLKKLKKLVLKAGKEQK